MGTGAVLTALSMLPGFIEFYKDNRNEFDKEIDSYIDKLRDRNQSVPFLEYEKILDEKKTEYWQNLFEQAQTNTQLQKKLEKAGVKIPEPEPQDEESLIEEFINGPPPEGIDLNDWLMMPEDYKREIYYGNETGIRENDEPNQDANDEPPSVVVEDPSVVVEEDVEKNVPKRKKSKKQQQQQFQQPLLPQVQDEDMEYIEVYLDSYDCTTSFSPSFTSLNWPKFLLNNRQLDNISAIKVLECSIPNTNYLFPTTGDTLFHISEYAGSSTQFDIPIGNYTSSELVTALETKLNNKNPDPSLFNDYTVIVEPATNKITITSDSTTLGDYFEIDVFLYYGRIFGLATNTTYYSSIYSVGNPCTLTFPYVCDVTGGSLFYYINSNTLGSTIDIQLPSNGIWGSNGTNNRQIAKVPIQGNAWDITFWQEPCPDRWFQVGNINLNNGLDIFISNSQRTTNAFDAINTPLDFNGMPFSIKLGLQRRMERIVNVSNGNSFTSQGQGNLKYYIDSTREGWFEADEPGGYRDPWDFSVDQEERGYIPATAPPPQQQRQNRKRKTRR